MSIMLDNTINTFVDNVDLTEYNSLTHLLELDDDRNDIHDTLEPSLYYNINDMISKCSDYSCNIMSLNCQSLNAKELDIRLLLNTYLEHDRPIHILALQETWFKDTDSIDMSPYQVDEYNLVTKNRYASEHGGLAFYIHKHFDYSIKQHIDHPNLWEEMYIEIIDPSNNAQTMFTVGNFYRPPHNTIDELDLFIEHVGRTLSQINLRQQFYICGDFNINLLQINNNAHNANFLECILSAGFLPAITLPSRLSQNSTLIDNIFFNQQEKINFSGILDNDISDHQAIFININIKYHKHKTKYITIYNNNDIAKENFRQHIQSQNLYAKLDKNFDADPNANYEIIESAIIHSMNMHMEKREVKFNRKKHKQDPWITFEILRSINTKNKLYKKLKKTNTESPYYQQRKSEFNVLRNNLRRIIRQAKKTYYTYQFDIHKNNIKKTWQTLGKALNKNNAKNSPDSIMIQGHPCTDKKVMANAFNNYFATICSQTNSMSSDDESYQNYLTARTENQFNFKLINHDITIQALSKFKPSHSCGHDLISNTTIKMIMYEISDCLTLIINQSFTTGIFPHKLKIAKVVPIHKKDDKMLINNYRPISVLPVISKLFENIMHCQIMSYFTSNNLLSTQQYGFIPNRSTELAALELMDRNINAMNDNLTPINIFLDLSKAFDSLDHNILLSKLLYYGFQSKSITLLKSYLLGRSQYVQLDGVTSDPHDIVCGIPEDRLWDLSYLIFL